MLAAGDVEDELLIILLRDVDEVALKLLLQLLLAGGNVLLPALLFKPGADLGARLAGLDNLEPVAARAIAWAFGGDDLDDHTGLQLKVQRHNPAVHLGAGHAVADL